MKKDQLLNIYTQQYAQHYNHKFLTNAFSIHSANFEHSVLKGLVNENTEWLDAGCGTGYFLSLFPGYKRAGLDISAGMLKEAQSVNPDAMFFREGDFRNDIVGWHNKWDLISSMWYPYSYLDSMIEFETMAMNFVRWLKPGGTLFLPICDMEDLRPLVPPIPYFEYEQVYAGSIAITGYTWTWIEDDGGKTHTHMIAPHVEHVAQLLSPYFESIEIIRYPPVYEGWVARKAIIAKVKVKSQDSNSQEKKDNIYRQATPAPIFPDQKVEENSIPEVPTPPAIASINNKQLAKEFIKRVLNGRFVKALVKRVMKP